MAYDPNLDLNSALREFANRSLDGFERTDGRWYQIVRLKEAILEVPMENPVKEITTATSLSKETDTRWFLQRDGIRRRNWLKEPVPVIENIQPPGTSYSIDYDDGLVTFTAPLTATPTIRNLRYVETLISAGYVDSFNAQRVAVINRVSTAPFWEETSFEGSWDLASGSKTIVTDHGGRSFELLQVSIEFSTSEAKATSFFLSTPAKDYNKSLHWFGLTEAEEASNTETRFSLEDVRFRFPAGSEFKITIGATTASNIVHWNITTDRRL